MPDPAAYRIEILGVQHDRQGFSCGVAPLDLYLKQQARQDALKRVAVAYVLTPDSKTVAGYYTLSQHSVALEAIPPETARKLPKYPAVPTTLLGRLAISQAFRGQRLGELLLTDALFACLETSRRVASVAVVVDAKDEAAVAFYLRYRFVEMLVPRRLFLPMESIERLFREGRDTE